MVTTNLWFFFFGSADESIEVPKATLSLEPFAPTVTLQVAVEIPAAVLSLEFYVPTVVEVDGDFFAANLVLYHSGASDIGGAIGVALTDDVVNNIWDDVSAGDASAGDTEYRCAYVQNTHDSISVANVAVEIGTDPAESNWELALGAAGKNGTETEVANEDTAPATPTFGTGSIAIGALDAGDNFPFWIKRIVSAGAGAATPDSGVLNVCGDDPN